MSEKDKINPSHYKFVDMESMDFVDNVLKYGKFKVHQAHYVANIIKYLVRAPRKNGLEDLQKARWYLNRLIEKWDGPGQDEISSVKMAKRDIEILKSATNTVDFWNACTEFYSDEELAWAWLHPELVEVSE